MKVKLTNPLVVKLVGLLASWVIRLWLGTTQIRFILDDPSSAPQRMKRRGVYLFWHETILFPAYTHARHGIAILVSRHRDGELITQVVRMLRGRAIRGSTTRGGAAALRGMMRDTRSPHLAITPDGPRGPRRVMQIGAVYLASRAGMLLVPVGFAARDGWRVPSWDGMIVPKPGRPVGVVVGEPIDVPDGLDREGLQRVRRRVQAAMDDVQRRAERLAAGPWNRDTLTLSQMRSA